MQRGRSRGLGPILMAAAGAAGLWAVAIATLAGAQDFGLSLAPLPAAPKVDAKQAALGRLLFFDGRLSGDSTVSCATCHDPAKGWTDGLPMSRGYPGSLYFRNTPTVVNATLGRWFYWDGRLPASDVQTMVRDHVSEAHFMQSDGRLIIEKLRQVPEYERGFREAFGGEPTYGRILGAVQAYLQTLRSADAPLDRHLRGDRSALSESARRGLDLFSGDAGCMGCHSGPLLSDGQFYDIGLAPNRDIFRDPLRHISFRRFFRTLGMPGYERLREDVGREALTKVARDRRSFRTPSLREVSRTAPYMHDGRFATLDEVVRQHYGEMLADEQRADVIAFLEACAGPPVTETPPELPAYQLRTLGEN